MTIANIQNDLADVPPRVLKLSREIVKREGGWVDHVDDPGGATNFGVSIRYARTKGLLFDLDSDGDVDKADIRLVTAEIAIGMFVIDFYLAMNLNLLPVGKLQANVFDMAVNAGGNAVKILQRMVGVADDGRLGLKTAAAVQSYVDRVGDAEANRLYSAARKAFYAKLIASKPSLGKFRNGWNNRADEMAH